MEAFEVLQQY